MHATLGPWRLGDRLGEGGQGSVWAAVHAATGLSAAVKVFHQGQGPGHVDAWRDEVRAVAGLAHPGVVTVHDLGTLPAAVAAHLGIPEGSAWMAMERADASLADRAPETLGALLDPLDEALAALAHVHAHGLLHLDLKPANLLLRRGTLRLTDFGVAQWHGQASAGSSIAGTPLFMAPEQITGRAPGIGPWSDLYALGWVAWTLFAGHPWYARDLGAVLTAQLVEEPEPPGPPAFAAWLARCLAKDPADRFATAVDARDALGAVRPDLDPDLPLRPTSPGQGASPTFSFTHGLAAPLDLDRPPPRPAPRALPPRQRARAFPADWRQLPTHRARPLPDAGLGLFRLRAVPLLGRAEARDALWGQLRDTVGGAGRAVWVRGPAGVGKSALARWLATTVVEHGLADAWTVPAVDGDDPMGALVRAGRARQADDDLELDVHTRVALDTLAGEAEEPVRLTPERTLRHLARWLQLRTLHRPVVLWIDDAHRATGRLELIRDLAQQPRVLVVATFQDEALAERGLADRLPVPDATLALPPLGDGDQRALVTHLLGLDSALQQTLAQRAGGNPLFAIQLLGDWIDRGLLRPDSGGFRLVEGARIPLPDDLAATWQARIARRTRGDDEAIAVERAAVLCAHAPAIPPGAWPGRGDLRERLLDARLLVATPEGAVRFVHGMLREALERRATAAGRLADHHRWAAARVDDPERRGLHLLAAGDPAGAVPPLLQAARRQLDHDRERARELLTLAEPGLRATAEPTLLVDHAIVASGLALLDGQPDEALRWLEGAVLAAREHPDLQLRLHARRMMLLVRSARAAEAGPVIEALERAARAVGGDAVDLAARWRAEWWLIQGAVAAAHDALADHLPPPDRYDTDAGDAWFTWGSILRARERFEASAEAYRTALHLFEAIERRAPTIAVLGGLADALRFQGRLDEAELAATAMLERAQRFEPFGEAYARLNLAAVAVDRGDDDEALAQCALAWDPASHLPPLAATVHAFRTQIAARRGDVATAHHELDGLEPLLATVVELDVAVALEAAAEAFDRLDPATADRCRALAAGQRTALAAG